MNLKWALGNCYQRRLTAILSRIPEYEIGRRAAGLLLAQIEQPGQKPETILVAPELVVRGSTASPDGRGAGSPQV